MKSTSSSETLVTVNSITSQKTSIFIKKSHRS